MPKIGEVIFMLNIKIKLACTLISFVFFSLIDATKAAKDKSALEKERTAKGVTSRTYVHNWKKMPNLTIKNIRQGEIMKVQPQRGRTTVIIFLASWCLPCQQIIGKIRKIEARYQKNFTDFLYIFSHDTEVDARGFMNTYGLKDNGFLNTKKVSLHFHQPQIPSIYVSDRYNWLTMRLLKPKSQDLKKLTDYLKIHTSF